MLSLMIIFAASLAFALGGTPVARSVAARLGMVDKPSARKIHSTPIPLMGGVAIYASVILAVALFGDRFYISQVLAILIAATLVSFLGVWDDRFALRPLPKLAAQAVAASLVVVAGVRVQLFSNPIIDGAVTLCWLLFITNAINYLDNMDGLCGGISAIAAAFFLLLAIQSGQYLVGALAAAVLGACIGFLVYNFNPASIFMGDGGSLFLGFLLAVVGIKLRFPSNVPLVTWMIPLLVLGVPIMDTTLVSLSRIRRGLSPLTPGKDHISHRAVRLGWTHREAVLALWVIACALGSIALFVTHADVIEAYTVAIVTVVLAVYALLRLERAWFAQVSRDKPDSPAPLAQPDQGT
ncbi:MAG: MraY family glycosyltransferase [Anaerolineae bacterium]